MLIRNVLKRIFGPDREGVMGDKNCMLRRFLCSTCPSLNLVGMITSKCRMMLARHVARVGVNNAQGGQKTVKRDELRDFMVGACSV
jgi:hypothetical protein